MTAPVHLVLLRHGQTNWNAEGRMQGQCDIPLNDIGFAQAEAAAPAVAALAPSRIIASDLKRAAGTAQIVAGHLGLPVSHDPRLREVCYGQWEGRTRPEIGEDVLAAVHRDPTLHRGVDGETMIAAADRTAAGLTDAAALVAPGETVLVVAHGTVARVGTLRLLGVDPALWESVRTMDNCHWLVLERRAEAWRLVSYNLGA